ncbi:hypothetical protein B0I00_2037 [Novosphingobium kunmingense]|uniref:DUF4071 domain-containing protein n=1 Tax=Novosphingobium kunmingense TaxID=1211806 RepID=A0A2N0H6B0_9SPHN|nr:tetratricopeptide repeat-containing protein [Novosphingobium kunmingense]PKB14449.1 hypothetical protein B0I00_2037 [Novosphingobium kunmingense]
MALSLPAIAALVRAGAVERAWDLFVSNGYAARTGDPAALAVRGRLLKAQARLAKGGERADLFAQAAEAYSAANAIGPAPYLAINAATLHFLAGDEARAQDEARRVLAVLDGPSEPADTPYFLAATRAEAAFLLRDSKAAQAAMAVAAEHNPDGWNDRATTIGQLREIAEARHEDAVWLDAFAPPASLHFAGHMGMASGGHAEARLAADVDAQIADLRIGFAWGALAAGSDIVIAERLLAAGAEVHLVLPCGVDLFESQSVAPAGEAWQARFRALIDRAASLRIAAGDPGAVHDPIATAHAGELAIGATLLNAQALNAAACQIIVTDAHGGGINTARQAIMWPSGAGLQRLQAIDRDITIEALFPPERHDPHRELVLHAAICIEELERGRSLDSKEVSRLSAPVAAALDGIERARIRTAPGRWELALADVGEALAMLVDVQARCRAAGTATPSIGAHIAIASLVPDPASGTLVPYGPGMAMAQRMEAMAPAGLTLISDALAVTMVARGVSGVRSELFHQGDEDSDGAVHLLLRLGQ